MIDQSPATTKAKHRRGAPQVTWLYPADLAARAAAEAAETTRPSASPTSDEPPRVARFLGLRSVETLDDLVVNGRRILELGWWCCRAGVVVALCVAYLVWAIVLR